jgi:hypothetical protein
MLENNIEPVTLKEQHGKHVLLHGIAHHHLTKGAHPLCSPDIALGLTRLDI